MRTYTPPQAKLVPEHATRVFKGVIYDTYQWEQELFDGTTTTFERLRRPDTVEAVCITDEGKILISKEQQPDTDEFYTIPGGRHDVESEDELAAAKREVKEELGYTFKNWTLIHVRQPDSKVERLLYQFLATGVESIGEQQLDAGEKIEILEFTFDEFKTLKSDPKMAYYPASLFDPLDSLEELQALPALHNYA